MAFQGTAIFMPRAWIHPEEKAAKPGEAWRLTKN